MKGKVEMNLFKHKDSILFGTPTFEMETIFLQLKEECRVQGQTGFVTLAEFGQVSQLL